MFLSQVVGDPSTAEELNVGAAGRSDTGKLEDI